MSWTRAGLYSIVPWLKNKPLRVKNILDSLCANEGMFGQDKILALTLLCFGLLVRPCGRQKFMKSHE